MDQFENDLRDALREAGNQTSVAGQVMARVAESRRRRIAFRYRFLIAAAAVVVFAGLSLAVLRNATVGENFRFEDNTTLKVADGARVEIRAKSELSLDNAADGSRIRLRTGSVIVNAAKQPPGRHLYVETKDAIVSAVGAVFFIDALEEGARVGVLEGEVIVTQGVAERRLHPGEQLATNPSLKLSSLQAEISWSRDAETYGALLQKSAIPLLPPLASGRNRDSLIAAAREGDVEGVRQVLDRGADPNVSVPGDGNPLIAAAGKGHVNIVRLLLDRGARIEDAVPGDENALITASREGRLDVVRLLVSRGANVNAKVSIDPQTSRSNITWRTPLSAAREEKRQDVVRFLLSSGARE